MRHLQEKICLVVPCYNEAKRLDFEKFRAAEDYYFLFVNDGSTDNTMEVINNNLGENIFILNLEKNMGKGEAVRRGFLRAKELPIFQEVNWIGFIDADLATPLSELGKFLFFCEFYEERIDAVWGSRVRRLGSHIERSAIRHYLGRVFATIVRVVLKLDSYDSQCGAKLFRKEIVDEFFSEPFISSWAFDIELLLRMSGSKIIEYPLQEWKDVQGGSLTIPSASLKMVYDILKLRLKYF